MEYSHLGLIVQSLKSYPTGNDTCAVSDQSLVLPTRGRTDKTRPRRHGNYLTVRFRRHQATVEI